MKKYISLDDIVAEIERIKKEECPTDCYEGRCKLLWFEQFLSFINTLEMKEVDLENSMSCKVGWYDGFLLDYMQEQQDELLKKIGANVGDKIRVILIKE